MMSKPTMSKDASMRLAVELHSLPLKSYPEVCLQIASAYGLSRRGELITNGTDVIVNEFSSPYYKVEMAWDNWSGFVVTARTPESETRIYQIRDWLEILGESSQVMGRTKP